jgi:hypothetical protein
MGPESFGGTVLVEYLKRTSSAHVERRPFSENRAGDVNDPKRAKTLEKEKRRQDPAAISDRANRMT